MSLAQSLTVGFVNVLDQFTSGLFKDFSGTLKGKNPTFQEQITRKVWALTQHNSHYDIILDYMYQRLYVHVELGIDGNKKAFQRTFKDPQGACEI